jgi:hypothetical protein
MIVPAWLQIRWIGRIGALDQQIRIGEGSPSGLQGFPALQHRESMRLSSELPPRQAARTRCGHFLVSASSLGSK